MLKLAANLHLDAIVPGDELRAELLRRHEVMGDKQVRGHEWRRPITPV